MGTFRIRTACIALALTSAALSGLSLQAAAAELHGYTYAPNWSLGSPQPVGLRMCSGLCPSHVPGRLGIESDTLDIALRSRPVIEAALNEVTRQNSLGRLAAGDEAALDWWDITIPNAEWVGLPATGGFVDYFNDGSQPAGFATDALAIVNIGGIANLWWESIFDPPNISMLPVDFDVMFQTDYGQTLTDNDMTSSAGTGPWSPTTPNMSQTTSTGGPLLPSVPEPATLGLVGAGLAAFGALRRRKRNSAV